MVFLDVCPPAVIQRVESADLGSPANAMLFSDIAALAGLDCQVAAVPAVADRLTSRSHPQVIDDFCASVGTYARFLDAAALGRVRAAYRRVPYSPVYAHSYFAGLRLTGIDLRAHLRGRIAEDWSFAQPRAANAATWHHFLYLASLGEPGALDRLAEKIAATKDGNDATNLLVSLGDLRVDGVDAILRRYASDRRTADGPEGPADTIAETVEILLSMRATD